jgi:hypothetical protein
MRRVGAVRRERGAQPQQREQLERWSSLRGLRTDLRKAQADWTQVTLGARDQRTGRDDEVMQFTLEENDDWKAGLVVQRLLNLCEPVRCCRRRIPTCVPVPGVGRRRSLWWWLPLAPRGIRV